MNGEPSWSHHCCSAFAWKKTKIIYWGPVLCLFRALLGNALSEASQRLAGGTRDAVPTAVPCQLPHFALGVCSRGEWEMFIVPAHTQLLPNVPGHCGVPGAGCLQLSLCPDHGA